MGWFKRTAIAAVLVGGAAAVTLWLLTQPTRLGAEEAAALGVGDATRGERIFYAGGCASCHAAPRAQGEEMLRLAGGVELKTPFGTFVAPNISQDQTDGIGAWSAEDFGNAVLKGVSPAGSHYYPAFPYASYARMEVGDVADLYAFMKTLPAVQGRARAHELAFPFNIRRGLGLWKRLYVSDEPVIALDGGAPEPVKRGRYLVEGPGHCGECHTPRSALGGTDKTRWLAGAVAAEGEGKVPNITPGEGGIGDWSESDLTYFLESGTLPDFDSVGGSMAAVIRNTSKLRAEDRAAMAAYLKALPPHPNGY